MLRPPSIYAQSYDQWLCGAGDRASTDSESLRTSAAAARLTRFAAMPRLAWHANATPGHRVAAARLAVQRTPRTAAGPRVSSDPTRIYFFIGSAAELSANKEIKINELTVKL